MSGDERPQIGRPLPRASEAVIPREKLTNYALDPTSERGRDKAVVFRAALAVDRVCTIVTSWKIVDLRPTLTSVRVAEKRFPRRLRRSTL